MHFLAQNGVALAYQAGIPGIVITYDERQRELAVTSGYLRVEVDDATRNFSRS